MRLYLPQWHSSVSYTHLERNAIAAARAFDANAYATLSDGSHMVSFDRVVEVMNETGHNLDVYKRQDAITTATATLMPTTCES